MDTECPYCKKEIDINHDDGYGYEDGELHQQECERCLKNFTYTTGTLYVYETYKADCLNGADHNFKATTTIPKVATLMSCIICDEKRSPTKEEWEEIYKDFNANWKNCPNCKLEKTYGELIAKDEYYCWNCHHKGD